MDGRLTAKLTLALAIRGSYWWFLLHRTRPNDNNMNQCTGEAASGGGECTCSADGPDCFPPPLLLGLLPVLLLLAAILEGCCCEGPRERRTGPIHAIACVEIK